MSDRDYKILLDAQAVARRLQIVEPSAKNTAANCANSIERLIEQMERITGEADGERDMAAAMRAPF
jgi:hypothetical protein